NFSFSEKPSASKYEGRRDSQLSAASSRESSQEGNNLLSQAIRKTPSSYKGKNGQQQLQGQTKATEGLGSYTLSVSSTSFKNWQWESPLDGTTNEMALAVGYLPHLQRLICENAAHLRKKIK
ncbi:hypothetical protein TNCV_3552951, partial [Trichonephila clavipes]